MSFSQKTIKPLNIVILLLVIRLILSFEVVHLVQLFNEEWLEIFNPLTYSAHLIIIREKNAFVMGQNQIILSASNIF